MKKIVLTALIGALASGSVLAQGFITFTASGTTRPIQYTFSSDGSSGLVKFPVATPSAAGTYGTMNVTMYSAAAGAVLASQSFNGFVIPDFSQNGWGIDSPIIQNIGPAVGGITGTQMTIAQTTPTAQVIIVGWTGSATDFATALQEAEAGTCLIGWSGSTLSGGAFSWLSTVGSSTSPANNPTGASAYNGLVMQQLTGVTPEPGTIALGGLGVAALLLFRRRK